MSSLQDALLKAGLADEKQLKKQPRGKPGSGRPNGRKATGKPSGDRKRKVRESSESDLERAYKARQRAEAREKQNERDRRVAEQEARRKRNLELDQLIRGSTLNRKDAELPRYFEHMSRIRRVLCTPEQRDQLNRAEIGVVNLRGSYLLVSLETLEKYREIAPDLVPDLAGRKEPEDDGSHYPPVPDDLIW